MNDRYGDEAAGLLYTDVDEDPEFELEEWDDDTDWSDNWGDWTEDED